VSDGKRIVGILLAAGRGERFGGEKLLAKVRAAVGAGPGAPAIAGNESIGALACRNLAAALPDVIAVVRPGDTELAESLRGAGARIVPCANAGDGMGASLACGVKAARDADGWIVALGDMPWIAESTIVRVVRAIAGGAVVAAPFHQGLRGHPVGFGAACFPELAALSNDDGAKSVVAAHRDALVRIDVDDAGTLRDVDRPDDLT
jgi:molybdenum cofactor cytidylyltransferase